jgi:hypothetical protein
MDKKNQGPDPGSRSGMNIPDHIPESLEPIFWVKKLKFFDVEPDSESGIFLSLDPGSGMEKFRSGITFRIRNTGNYPIVVIYFIVDILCDWRWICRKYWIKMGRRQHASPFLRIFLVSQHFKHRYRISFSNAGGY